jgi:tetratricopeptide (TPR) repeat protein
LIQIRLSESTAVLALLIADALMKCGETARASFWYGTARMAADDTHNMQLRALVRAQQAMLPYYFGRVERAVRLAQTAQQIAIGLPCDAVALAAAAEARGLARLGDRDGAEAALARARAMAEKIDRPSDEAFRFNDKRLLLYASGTLTCLGETARARDAQRQALDLHAASPHTGAVIDPALVELDAAACDASDGAVDDACGRAVHTITSLPEEHRTKIILARATAIAPALPPRHQMHRAVGNLLELIAATAQSSA